MLKGKKIILGVTGSIAAYKAATVVRLLIKAGAEVQVVMTESAATFITPLTLATLSGQPVLRALTTEDEWNNHVALGRAADVLVVAPASANTLAKMSQGLCDNLLLATYLSADCPVFVAPAMDVDMWQHPATVSNVQRLQQRGVRLLDVENGPLASGLSGPGRMAEPDHILAALETFFQGRQALKGKRALVTAGPTYEPIDPVRFIGNFSSGKMGIALAEALAEKGAQVDLVLGPVGERQGQIAPGITVHSVTTALEMQAFCVQLFPAMDIAVLAAAVADYRPAHPAGQKIKKSGKVPPLSLVENPDILKQLGQRKKAGQLLVGFALETEQGEQNARKKLQAKNLDIIALNSLQDEGAGFQTDTNKVTLLDRSGERTVLPLASKRVVADQMVAYITAMYEKDR